MLAVIPKGRDVWELHVDQQEIRDKIEVGRVSISWETLRSVPQVPHLGEGEGSPSRRYQHLCGQTSQCLWLGGRGDTLLHIAKHRHKDWRKDTKIEVGEGYTRENKKRIFVDFAPIPRSAGSMFPVWYGRPPAMGMRGGEWGKILCKCSAGGCSCHRKPTLTHPNPPHPNRRIYPLERFWRNL